MFWSAALHNFPTWTQSSPNECKEDHWGNTWGLHSIMVVIHCGRVEIQLKSHGHYLQYTFAQKAHSQVGLAQNSMGFEQQQHYLYWNGRMDLYWIITLLTSSFINLKLRVSTINPLFSFFFIGLTWSRFWEVWKKYNSCCEQTRGQLWLLWKKSYLHCIKEMRCILESKNSQRITNLLLVAWQSIELSQKSLHHFWEEILLRKFWTTIMHENENKHKASPKPSQTQTWNYTPATF